MTDVTMNPTTGLASWNVGFNRLVDVMVALHRRGQLELSTVNAASKACSECWNVAGSWRNMEEPTRTLPSEPIQTNTDQPGLDLPSPLIAADPVPSNQNTTDIQVDSTDASDTNDTHDLSTLSPIRAHYLKKTLIQLQFNKELDIITSPAHGTVSSLSYLGPPFRPPPKDASRINLPFLRYIFRQFVLTFPFLDEAPKDFFPDKLQPFVASVLSKNLSPTSVMDDDAEQIGEASKSTRKKLMTKAERSLSILLSSGIKLVEPEQVVRLSQADLNRLEAIAKNRLARERKSKDALDVNIVCVRTVVSKGRVRSKAHDEFIIRTRRRGRPDIFVGRRHGDFKTLANELRKAYPDAPVRPPPGKDHGYVNAGATPKSPTSADYYGPGDSNDSLPMTSDGGNISSSARLGREKNRLTLRAYLRTLISTSVTAHSPVLLSFLLSNPTTLSQSEVEDAQRREEADRTREDGRKRFAKEIANRVDGLREAVQSVKGDLMGKDGLTKIFATIKITPDITQLPPNYQAVIEWARMSLASTIFHHFVASDEASESFTSMKRIHGLMPYFMMKAALKISNPVAMIRSMLDLFLAQPFGGKSLLQRMFTSSLMEEVKMLEEDIEAVKEKVDDPMMCEKVRLFIYAPPEIQQFYKEESVAEEMHLIAIVLRNSEHPVLSRPQMYRVSKAWEKYRQYIKYKRELNDSDDDEGPADEEAWLFEDLQLLGKLYSRLRDREQLISLIFEGNTADLLRDIITIFYSPLAQVYKAANIADSLGDLQAFMNDMIRTIEQTEELSQEDPHRAVQAFIDLVKRHEQMFYNFVYKIHSRGGSLFDNLMKWIELFLTIVRDGIGDQTSVEFLLPYTGQEREAIMKEIDEVALYHYKLKLAHEDKVRRRFGRTQKQGDADAEDEAAAALVQGVVNDISFGDLIDGDAEDLAAEVSASDGSSDYSSSDEYDSNEESDDDSEEDSEGGRPPPPPKSLRPERPGGAGSIGHKSNHVGSTPRTRATTMKTSHSNATASTVLLDLVAKERLSVAQRLRNSKSMEMLRRDKSVSTDSPPPPPIPHQHRPYQPYHSKRSAKTSSAGLPRLTPQSSSGSWQHPPPTRRPPSPPKEATTTIAATTSRKRSKSVSNPTSTTDSQNSTTTGEGPTWSSETSLESDKNKPLPDPKARVGLDPDRTPSMLQRDLDATPQVGQKKPKLKKVVDQIKPPELTHIPKLLPIFVELFSDNLSRVVKRG
ncbi:hypothetical protein BDM02DRAFT_3189196 [Thelephora ganbajun]|uniref:Uncharacterized protein n=1 Tax=Thelephora ganbajun TaxID=370292 RepID=A0ACB6Z912_THEGA|nr:hypothetical protein BDM02DRAFT_3189196 [Thelephora ganbajun]